VVDKTAIFEARTQDQELHARRPAIPGR
jgi:hypothetical protein